MISEVTTESRVTARLSRVQHDCLPTPENQQPGVATAMVTERSTEGGGTAAHSGARALQLSSFEVTSTGLGAWRAPDGAGVSQLGSTCPLELQLTVVAAERTLEEPSLQTPVMPAGKAAPLLQKSAEWTQAGQGQTTAKAAALCKAPPPKLTIKAPPRKSQPPSQVQQQMILTEQQPTRLIGAAWKQAYPPS